MRLSLTWSINSPFGGLFPDYGQIAHLLRTRAPVADICIATNSLPLDLHVLGLSLAFILSQDQTLRCKYLSLDIFYLIKETNPLTNLLKCTNWQGHLQDSFTESLFEQLLQSLCVPFCSCTTFLLSICQSYPHHLLSFSSCLSSHPLRSGRKKNYWG